MVRPLATGRFRDRPRPSWSLHKVHSPTNRTFPDLTGPPPLRSASRPSGGQRRDRGRLAMTDTPKALPVSTPSKYVVGEPDSSGTSVTISEASKRLGVSVSTLRRRLQKGEVAGAYKTGGPDGLEWRIPVTYLPEPSSTPEVRSDSVEVVELRSRLEVSEALRLRAESEVDNLRRALSDALTKIPPAIAPPPPTPKKRWWSRSEK